jgi:hypothetical protein
MEQELTMTATNIEPWEQGNDQGAPGKQQVKEQKIPTRASNAPQDGRLSDPRHDNPPAAKGPMRTIATVDA